MHNIIFTKSHPVLKKVVIIENFKDKTAHEQGLSPLELASYNTAHTELPEGNELDYDNSILPKKFCATHFSDFKAGDAACRKLLTSDTCNLTDCCVWASHQVGGAGCVSGNHLGPTFNASDYYPDFLFGGKKHTI